MKFSKNDSDAIDSETKVEGAMRDKDRVLSTKTLFGEKDEIFLNHAGTLYRLKITKYGKLILNK